LYQALIFRMKASFDPEQQIGRIESKIVVALERLFEAFRVLLWQEGKRHGLSPIQIQVLLFLYYHSSDKSRISYLADEFNMTKATMSDSVRILFQKGLVEKQLDQSDARSHLMHLTEAGRRIAIDTEHYASIMEESLAGLSPLLQQSMMEGLLELIAGLSRSGVITAQRMCTSCRYYSRRSGKVFCSLLQQELSSIEIRLDCPEHSPNEDADKGY
jgi:DNA-binding MarR family transcriptional regulator